MVIGIMILVLVFFAGKQYGQSSTLAQEAGQRQARFQGQNGAGGVRNGRNGAGFTAGEVISKDDKSVTIKSGTDGGSKIIFFTSSTPITKNVGGTTDDVAIGEQIVVTGPANPDGSVSAQSIQIRPAMMPGQGFGQLGQPVSK